MADLALQLQAENLPFDKIEQLLVEGRWAPTLTRLMTGENLLLEGCRGVGKTMLMRAAATRLASSINEKKVLGIHATFKRYLATIPPSDAQSSHELGNFKAWVNARILYSLKNQLDNIFGKPGNIGRISAGKLDTIEWPKVIAILETTYRGELKGLVQSIHESGLSPSDFQQLQGYTFTTEMLQQVRHAFGLRTIILLLDDAAHALDTRAQGEFFTLVKSLYGEGLVFKIAVYPAVTRYGLDFSYGHDAIVVSMSDIPRAEVMDNYMELLQKRCRLSDGEDDSGTIKLLQHLINERQDWVRLLIYCANGNPRGLLKLVSQILTTIGDRKPTEVRYDDVRSAINYVIDRHLDNMVPGVIKDQDLRLMKAAEILLTAFRDRIRENPWQGSPGGSPRMYLAITNSMQIPFLCNAAVRLLVAADVLTAQGPVRLGGTRENGTVYLLNPGFVFRDNVLSKIDAGLIAAERWLKHFGGMSPRVHAEISKSAQIWQEAYQEAIAEPWRRCVNGHAISNSTLCEMCGASAVASSPAELLLMQEIDVLELTDGIKQRLKDHGFKTVRQLFEARDEQIDEVPYIGTKRLQVVRKIIQVAMDEFLSG